MLSITRLNDYTPHIFGQDWVTDCEASKSHHRTPVGPTAICSTDKKVMYLIWDYTSSWTHLTTQGCMPGLFFFRMSSPQMVTQLTVPVSNCLWIATFLTDRQQQVRLGGIFLLHKNHQHYWYQGVCHFPTHPLTDCTSVDKSVKLLKFANDTIIFCLVQQKIASLPSDRRWIGWSIGAVRNNLELNLL